MQRREYQVLKLLESGPLPTGKIARMMDISRRHAGTILRGLRRLERTAIVGVERGQGTPANLWGLIRRRERAQDQFAPVRKLEERDAERERWMLGILDQWCRFMRAYWGPAGYPSHTPGMAARARIHSFEDLEIENDRYLVSTCDACIDSLPNDLRSAIYFRYGLLDVWTGPPVADVFDRAAERLLDRLANRLCAP